MAFYNSFRNFYRHNIIFAHLLIFCLITQNCVNGDETKKFTVLLNQCEKSSSVKNWTTIQYFGAQDPESLTLVNFKLDALVKQEKFCNTVETILHVVVKGERILHGRDEDGNEILMDIGSDGTLQFSSKHYHFLPKSTYCIQKNTTSMSEIRVCDQKQFPPIKKCCPQKMTLDVTETTTTCVMTQNGEQQDANSIHLGMDRGSQNKSRLRIGPPTTCTNFTMISTALKHRNEAVTPFVVENGVVKYLDRTNQKWQRSSENEDYCYDVLNISPETQGKCGKEENDVVLICLHNKNNDQVDVNTRYDKITEVAYVLFLIVAMLFIFATVAIHILLRERQNVHSWTLLSYLMSQLVFYFLLVVIRMDHLNWIGLSASLKSCFTVGVMTHFFGFFSFCWLSMVNFDLWWTFRVLNPVNERTFNYKRYLAYMCFPIVLSSLLIGVSLAFHYSYDENTCRADSHTILIYPQYAKNICFLSNSAKLYYFYGPVGVLLLVNLIFYTTTTMQIFQIFKARRKSGVQNRYTNPKQSCYLFLKLFMVMGFTWIFEIIQNFFDTGKSHKWYWILLDMANIFQAVAIFIIFVCKRETLRALQQNYPKLTKVLSPILARRESVTIADRSTEGSTKVSRLENYKNGTPDGLGYQRRASVVEMTV